MTKLEAAAAGAACEVFAALLNAPRPQRRAAAAGAAAGRLRLVRGPHPGGRLRGGSHRAGAPGLLRPDAGHAGTVPELPRLQDLPRLLALEIRLRRRPTPARLDRRLCSAGFPCAIPTGSATAWTSCAAARMRWNAPFPLPVFCPLDNIRPAEKRKLADLTFVKKREDRRSPFAGCPADTGSPPRPSCSTRASPLGPTSSGSGVGDHGADLAGGRGAHGQALCERSHRPLSSLQGRLLLHEDQRPRGGRPGVPVPAGLHRRPGKSHYDHVYATELFSNRSMRPAHDFVMALGSTGPCATSWP